MSTGLTSWSNPGEIGGLYPLAGWEIPLVIVATVLWLVWHVRQTRDESVEYDEALEMYERIGLERALHHGGGARVADPHDLLAGGASGVPGAGAPVTVAGDGETDLAGPVAHGTAVAGAGETEPAVSDTDPAERPGPRA